MSPRLLTIAKAVLGRRPLVREPDTTVPETGAVAMAREPKAAERPIDPHWVRHALSGNLCRCTGYEGIVKAVCEGLETMQTAAAQ